MLYPKNSAPELDPKLFENPTSEYRGAPFWAWNCKLEKEELLRQIECLREMGLGGFHMHVRTGMATPYLSDEFLDLISACVERAREDNMLAWLYDEDRWPSGAAGGLVTKDARYRARHLLFTPVPYSGKMDTSGARETRSENGALLACFDIVLDEKGCLKSWDTMREQGPAKGTKWYAYLETSLPSPWYNNQSYVNTLDKASMDRFIEITYERYKERFQKDFGGVIPAIFTDEPQFSHKGTLEFAFDKQDVMLPWTDDLADTFRTAYGEELIPNIPQLFWELPDGKISLIRYHYHDHVSERFAEAFADNCGSWCQNHHLMLTGHMLSEESLCSQTRAVGDVMRSYRGFDLPGIDMLCARFEYNTAKQAQSAVHQYGRQGMMSELYGVTNWDFDFRGHKLHGDWQAALGVTVRVQHLSWVSMAGEAKRDYPASISYQSPWYQEYSYIEDHFARVNTAMTRGKPVVKVGVIHPVESYWLHWGPSEQTAFIREQMDQNFEDIAKWLLFGSIDFDYICESLLPAQCPSGGAPLQVGEMAYDAVLVPCCETLRGTTLERLDAFQKAGGKLVFVGEAPSRIDGLPSEEGKRLCERAECIPMSRPAVLEALEDMRQVDIRGADGRYTDNLLYQMRQDGDRRWLFIAHGTEPYNKDISRPQKVRITIKGHWSPVVCNTLDGTMEPSPYSVEGENTIVNTTLYDYDSLLLRLDQPGETQVHKTEAPTVEGKQVPIPVMVPVTLTEPNVVLLDMAEYALDGENYQPEEELLIADNLCRQKLGWPKRCNNVAQPWVIPEETLAHAVSLRFTVPSEIEAEKIHLAVEDAERLEITWNGAAVKPEPDGWYVDKSIKTVPLPGLRKGDNILELKIPFGQRTNVEWCYLLGDFGVWVQGRGKTITNPVRELAFGDITSQGLPFYGGNIIYHIDVPKGGSISVKASRYRGAAISVDLDGKRAGRIVYPPYTLDIPCGKGTPHKLDITLYGNRVNTFGQVHLADSQVTWFGPDSWRTTGDAWSYEYVLRPTGILTAPVILQK